MKLHSFTSHTPEEKRRLSNLGHIVVGALLAAVGGLALLRSLSGIAWASTAWPILILVAGLLLLFLIYPRHPLSEWPLIWRDGQQREHTIMAAAIAAAGAAELLRANLMALSYIFPAAILLIGGLFVVHEQHGMSQAAAKAVRQHRILGVTIITAGILRVVEVVAGAGLFAILWPLGLLAAATQLILYREPEGAYEAEGGHSGHARH